MQYLSNVQIIEVFYVGTAGLVNADFTKNVYLNGAVSAVVGTVTAIASGFYYLSFTPNAEGYWDLDVIRTSDTSVRYQKNYKVDDKFEVSVAFPTSFVASNIGSITAIPANINELRFLLIRIENLIKGLNKYTSNLGSK